MLIRMPLPMNIPMSNPTGVSLKTDEIDADLYQCLG